MVFFLFFFFSNLNVLKSIRLAKKKCKNVYTVFGILLSFLRNQPVQKIKGKAQNKLKTSLGRQRRLYIKEKWHLRRKRKTQGQTPRGAFDSCVTFDNKIYISVLF